MTDPRQRRFSPEVRERAVRLVRQQQQGDHPSEWAAIGEAARDGEFIAFMQDRQGFTVRARDGSAERQELLDFDRNWGPRLAASARG